MEDGVRRIIGPRSYIRIKRDFDLKEIAICKEYENTIKELENTINDLKNNFLVDKANLNVEINYRDETIESLSIECDRLDLQIVQQQEEIEDILDDSSRLQNKIQDLESELSTLTD